MPMDALVVAGLNGTNRHSPSPAGRVQSQHSAGRVQPARFSRRIQLALWVNPRFVLDTFAIRVADSKSQGFTSLLRAT